MHEQMKTICSDLDSINAVGSYKGQHISQARREDNGKQSSGEKGKFAVHECWNCGQQHAFYKRELYKLNHYAKKCCSGKDIKAVEENDGEVDTIDMPKDMNTTDMMKTEMKCSLPGHLASWMTHKSKGHMRFQIDTGAECNVLPVALYKKATEDNGLTRILTYGGTKLPVIGKVSIQVLRLGIPHTICCKLIDSPNVCALLGHKACV